MYHKRTAADGKGWLQTTAGALGLVALILLNASGGATKAEEPAKARQKSDIAMYATKLEDIEATVQVTKFEPKELEKIGKDFGTTYLFRTLQFQYKQPDKMRLEGSSKVLGSGLFILNGVNRFYNVPRLGRKGKENLEKTPGKRQSLLEYCGLLSPTTLRFMQPRFLREEAFDGSPTAIYDLTYQGVQGGSYYRLWIDTRTHVTLKREWYDGENHLRATFLYLDPKEAAPGVWLPGRIEIKNGEGTLSAATTFSDVKINQGLDDSLFAIAP